MRKIDDIPKNGFIPAHIGKWGEISKFMHEVPAVEIELTKNGGLFGDIYIEQPQDIDENYNGYGDLDNVYILPQTLGEKLGVLLGTVRKHLFGPKSISIDNPRYYPNALFLLNGEGKEICLFDQDIYGWDAVECDYSYGVPRDRIKVTCIACGATEFRPRFSWVGYQVFDGEPATLEGAIKFRNSFDSITIEIICTNCGAKESILEAETA